MKTFKILICVVLSALAFAACSDTETYADQKKKERSAINRYIANQKIKVINEEQFFAQDTTTDVSKNEYVLFESNGVYMQIVRKGCGEKIEECESTTVLCRFNEYNLIESDTTLQLTNIYQYAWLVDKMNVRNTSGTFTASFDTSSSLMYTRYGTAAVPSGWLVPLRYVNIGRPTNEGDEVAKVNLIVPHSEGQDDAARYVYPCRYEITFERGR